MTKALCETRQRPGPRLNLVLRDIGEIDFLNAPTYIDHPTHEVKFDDRPIAADRPAETATKTLVYRASKLTAHDAFDLAAVYLYHRLAMNEVAQCPAVIDQVVARALNRLNLAKRRHQSEMRDLINPTPRGEEFIDNSCEIAWRPSRSSESAPEKRDRTKQRNAVFLKSRAEASVWRVERSTG